MDEIEKEKEGARGRSRVRVRKRYRERTHSFVGWWVDGSTDTHAYTMRTDIYIYIYIYRARTCALVILVGSEILLFVGTVFVSSEPRRRERYYYYYYFFVFLGRRGVKIHRGLAREGAAGERKTLRYGGTW